ncbi:hypothetical protein AVEN_100772-1 [Araneus ventricosus]|uniref:DUF4817 domain-containing protein n=1 Tax=Araneus ventricosus TaxID=182803 RepID=A0A4Y2AXF2_ARAVE|nr:hypothetical protein AVEN_100772-1 [Araneus ventricosus]
MVNAVPVSVCHYIRFQDCGAPVHFTTQVRAHLQATYAERWIGHGGLIAWPPPSPDLSPILKELEYEVGRIVEAAGCVRNTPSIFEEVRHSTQPVL